MLKLEGEGIQCIVLQQNRVTRSEMCNNYIELSMIAFHAIIFVYL